MTVDAQLQQLLDSGNATTYVDRRLFGNSIDDLDNHIRRKKAVANPARYSILYLLFEYGELSRKRLSDEIGRTSNSLQQPLRELLDVNLVEKIPGPDGADKRRTYYRITTLGKQEIASDLRNIIGGNAAEDRYQSLGDPYLVEYMDPDSGRIRHAGDVDIDVLPENLKKCQDGLKRQYAFYQRAESASGVEQ